MVAVTVVLSCWTAAPVLPWWPRSSQTRSLHDGGYDRCRHLRWTHWRRCEGHGPSWWCSQVWRSGSAHRLCTSCRTQAVILLTQPLFTCLKVHLWSADLTLGMDPRLLVPQRKPTTFPRGTILILTLAGGGVGVATSSRGSVATKMRDWRVSFHRDVIEIRQETAGGSDSPEGERLNSP